MFSMDYNFMAGFGKVFTNWTVTEDKTQSFNVTDVRKIKIYFNTF